MLKQERCQTVKRIFVRRTEPVCRDPYHRDACTELPDTFEATMSAPYAEPTATRLRTRR